MNVKVILNRDLSTLGEEGDVKEVAKGFARNFLFPRSIALPYTERTVQLFEKRKDEIEARKLAKRQDAESVKTRLEALDLTLTMPAGANGKLYGAVTSLTIVDELAKQGFQIERKRVELPGNSIKSVGKYKTLVKLYGAASAELTVTVQAQPVESAAVPRKEKGRSKAAPGETESGAVPAAEGANAAVISAPEGEGTLPPESAEAEDSAAEKTAAA